MARCAYTYNASGDRCVYTGCDNEGDFCPAHKVIMRNEEAKERKRQLDREYVATNGIPDAIRCPPRKRPKLSQPSRVQSAKEIMDTLPPVPSSSVIIDRTAPWCSCMNAELGELCRRCGKPHWDDWRRKVAARTRRPPTPSS